MSEFLLELYSEEIPPQLQIGARTQLKQLLENSLKEEGVNCKEFLEYSTPTRLSLLILNNQTSILQVHFLFQQNFQRNLTL